MSSLLQRFYVEIGLKTLISSPVDTKILCLQRVVRLFAYGGTTLILALFLSSLGISDERIGLFMTLTLLGDVVISLVLTIIADGIGRRRMLGLGSLLMTASGIVFATCSNYWILVTASVLGVISPRYLPSSGRSITTANMDLQRKRNRTIQSHRRVDNIPIDTGERAQQRPGLVYSFGYRRRSWRYTSLRMGGAEATGSRLDGHRSLQGHFLGLCRDGSHKVPSVAHS